MQPLAGGDQVAPAQGAALPSFDRNFCDRTFAVTWGQVAGTVVCEAVYSLKDNQVSHFQPFTALFLQECMGQLASVGPT